MNNTTMPRPEYPRPQWKRDAWINLNGAWEYQTDRAVSGEARGLWGDVPYTETITVPFCRESVLSGIGDVDFCDCVWYRKKITLPEGWQAEGRRTILHIGACDYQTKVWVNGQALGEHIGGYVAFSFDMTPALKEGENTITIRAFDDVRSGNQPGGKQSPLYHSHACFYTRTTGIWQTVWLENVAEAYITGAKYYPDIHNNRIRIEARVQGGEGMTLSAKASYQGKPQGEAQAVVRGGRVELEMDLAELYLWEVGEGRLYDLTLTLGADCVESYFGMREVTVKDGMLYLNDKIIFQRLILDQGFYPDGIYTAPCEGELIADIDRSLAMGFNGARLHQKVFEPLFLYWCDVKGYIVWGEHANWCLDISRQTAYENFLPEWCEVMERDFNHPAIVGWCPLNETQVNQNPRFVKLLATVTRQYDTTRAYIDASGWTHIEGLTDIMDLHDYEQNPEVFASKLAPLAEGGTYDVHWHSPDPNMHMQAHPTFVSEYGGIRWASEEDAGWGYGNAPKSGEEFLSRFKGLTEAIMNHPKMGALCYTQLTDVEQEVNGLYTYDRQAKFDPEFFRGVLSQVAAVEKE